MIKSADPRNKEGGVRLSVTPIPGAQPLCACAPGSNSVESKYKKKGFVCRTTSPWDTFEWKESC